MISVQQWRAAIGCFSPNRRKTHTNHGIVFSAQLTSLGLRLTLFLSLCIVIAGDVETNPGPEYADILAEIRGFRKDCEENFDSLQNEISKVRKEIIQVK